MSQDYIHKLPTEVLTICFDMLRFKKQLEIMSTCYRWYNILTDERYLRTRRFSICVDNIRCLDGNGRSKLCNVKQIQRYQAFRISDSSKSTEQETDFLEAVRLFLFRKQVMANVEDLLLCLDRISLANLFSNSQRRNFPKLERIIDCSETMVNSDDRIVLNAPNLRRLKMEASRVAASPLVHRFSGQIEELSIDSEGMNVFPKLIETVTYFSNLNSLTLVAYSFQYCRNLEFNDASEKQRQIFAQLKYLKIYDGCGIFNSIVENILWAASNLETLILITTAINRVSFNAVKCMQGLKKLCFSASLYEIYISYNKTNENGLSLPELERLTTFNGVLPPLKSLPKLKWLTLRNHSYREFETPSIWGLRAINPQLETLHFVELDFNPNIIHVIRGFKNLKSLELRLVEVNVGYIWRILNVLPSLRRFSVIYSNLVKKSEHDWREESLTDDERRDFFEKLRLEHPSKRIEDINNTYTLYVKQLRLERASRKNLE